VLFAQPLGQRREAGGGDDARTSEPAPELLPGGRRTGAADAAGAAEPAQPSGFPVGMDGLLLSGLMVRKKTANKTARKRAEPTSSCPPETRPPASEPAPPGALMRGRLALAGRGGGVERSARAPG